MPPGNIIFYQLTGNIDSRSHDSNFIYFTITMMAINAYKPLCQPQPNMSHHLQDAKFYVTSSTLSLLFNIPLTQVLLRKDWILRKSDTLQLYIRELLHDCSKILNFTFLAFLTKCLLNIFSLHIVQNLSNDLIILTQQSGQHFPQWLNFNWRGLLQHVLSLWHILSLRWQNVSNLMHSVMLHHYMVTKRAERSTRCILSPLQQQHYNLIFPLPLMCVCVCVCVCWYKFVCGSAKVSVCVLWCTVFYFIIPTSISAKLKFCIALNRLWGDCCPKLCEIWLQRQCVVDVP